MKKVTHIDKNRQVLQNIIDIITKMHESGDLEDLVVVAATKKNVEAFVSTEDPSNYLGIVGALKTTTDSIVYDKLRSGEGIVHDL